MSMYNMLFGMNPFCDLALAAVNLSREECGRFRDAFVERAKDGTVRVAVYTRNGGGNREGYMPDFSNHPNYLFDRDDDFDSTYATIYFSIPEKYEKKLSSLIVKDPKTVSEKFEGLIQDMEAGKDTPQVKNALNFGEQLVSKIQEVTGEKSKGGQENDT